MKKIFKNLISLNLIILIILGGVFLPIKKTSAENAGEVIGRELSVLAGAYMATPAVCTGYAEAIELGSGLVQGAKSLIKNKIGDKIKNKIAGWFGNKTEEVISQTVPTHDALTKNKLGDEESKNRIQQRTTSCTNFLREVVLQSYKKRLLDKLVNQTVKWIQGQDSEPSFVQNPKQLIEDARNQAIGDIISETQYSDLCYSDMSFRLNLSLVDTQFSDRVGCTLDDVVENLNSFKEDFTKGGWIAYQQSLRMENNPTGISFLTQQEALDRTIDNENIAQYEANIGSGFFGQKECLRWEYKPTNPDYMEPLGCDYNENGLVYCDSSINNYNYKQKSPDGKSYTGTNDSPGNSVYRCVESNIVTPGSIAANSITKALDTEYDFLINADDLSTYGAAIIDAAINRVAHIGADGLAYLSTEKDDRDCSDLEDQWLKEYCERNQGSPTKQESPENGTLNERWENATTTLSVAEDTWKSAKTINEELITVIEEVIACKENNGDPIENEESLIEEASTRNELVDSKINDIPTIRNTLTSLKTNIDNKTNLQQTSEILDDLNKRLTDFLEESMDIEEKTQELKTEQQSNLETCLLNEDE